jgi:hypothetical protein
VAAFHNHTCGACQTGTDYFTYGRQGVDFPYCRDRRDQPALCVQVGTAFSATDLPPKPKMLEAS